MNRDIAEANTARIEYDTSGPAFRTSDADTLPEPKIGTKAIYPTDRFAIVIRELPSNQVLNELISVNACH
jgi:hypothetical protein